MEKDALNGNFSSEGETEAVNTGAQEDKTAEVDYSRAAGVKETIRSEDGGAQTERGENAGAQRASFAWSSSGDSYGKYEGGGNGTYQERSRQKYEGGGSDSWKSEYQGQEPEDLSAAESGYSEAAGTEDGSEV